jgi:hypothetical protein
VQDFRPFAEALLRAKAAGIEDAAARRAAGDSDYMPVVLGAVRLYEAGKAPARRLTARYGCGLKLVVHEVDLRVLILERPKAEG